MPWCVESVNGRKEVGRWTRYVAMEWELNLPHTASNALYLWFSGSTNADNAGSEVSCCVLLR